MPFGVFQKSAGVFGVILHTQEIAHGIYVLVACEAVVVHPGTRGHACVLAFLHSSGNPLHHLCTGRCSRLLLFLLGRHLARIDPLHDLQPLRCVFKAHFRRQCIHAEVSLLHIRVVALQAVLLEVALHLGVQDCGRRSLSGPAQDNEQTGGKAGKQGAVGHSAEIRPVGGVHAPPPNYRGMACQQGCSTSSFVSSFSRNALASMPPAKPVSLPFAPITR